MPIRPYSYMLSPTLLILEQFRCGFSIVGIVQFVLFVSYVQVAP